MYNKYLDVYPFVDLLGQYGGWSGYSLDCKGLGLVEYRTGGPESVPVPQRKPFNGTSTS